MHLYIGLYPLNGFGLAGAVAIAFFNVFSAALVPDRKFVIHNFDVQTETGGRGEADLTATQDSCIG